jgi:hypothetical protein
MRPTTGNAASRRSSCARLIRLSSACPLVTTRIARCFALGIAAKLVDVVSGVDQFACRQFRRDEEHVEVPTRTRAMPTPLPTRDGASITTHRNVDRNSGKTASTPASVGDRNDAQSPSGHEGCLERPSSIGDLPERVLVTVEEFRHATFDVAISRVRTERHTGVFAAATSRSANSTAIPRFAAFSRVFVIPTLTPSGAGSVVTSSQASGSGLVVTFLCRPRSALSSSHYFAMCRMSHRPARSR